MRRRGVGYVPGGWRTGEVWLDPQELEWFGEVRRTVRESVLTPLEPLIPLQPGFAAAGAGVLGGSVAVPGRDVGTRGRLFGPRLTPAVLALAALGVGVPVALTGQQGAGAPAEEPEPLRAAPFPATERTLLPEGSAIAPGERGGPASATAGAPAQARPTAGDAAGSQAAEQPFPVIRWRDSVALGVPHAGRLVGGVRLPQRGPGWRTWDPVRDRIPNRANRLYGTDALIRTLVDVIAAYRLAHPGAPPLLVGDVSRRGGGEIDEHASHENGLDVDIYYPRTDGRVLPPSTPSQVDLRLAQDVVDRFVEAGAQVIFVSQALPLRGPSGVVVPYPNHENHLHVRFPADAVAAD